MSAKHVLALDLASASGLAFGPVGGRPRMELLRLGDKTVPSEERAKNLMRVLMTFLSVETPDLVVIEEPLNPGVMARIGATFAVAELAYGLPIVAKMVCRSKGAHRIKYVRVQDATEHFTGVRTYRDWKDPNTGKTMKSRQVRKHAIMNACRLRGWPVDDDNCADAAALWSYGCALIASQEALKSTPLFRGVRALP